MGKRGSRQQRPGGGKASQGGVMPMPVVGLAGACGLAAMMYKPLLSLLPGPQSTVEFCPFGYEAEYKSIEQLMQRSTPCIVRGLEPELHASLVRQMSPVALKALPASELFLRVSEGDSHTRILQHSNTNVKEKNFFDEALQLTWPTSPYDGWKFAQTTVKQLLNPPRAYSASFVQDVSDIAARCPFCNMQHTLRCWLTVFCDACRFLTWIRSCPKSSKQQQHLLMLSAPTTAQTLSPSGEQSGWSRAVSASKCTATHQPTCWFTCTVTDKSFSLRQMSCCATPMSIRLSIRTHRASLSRASLPGAARNGTDRSLDTDCHTTNRRRRPGMTIARKR